MFGSKTRLVLGGLTAVAIGTAGGWTLMAEKPAAAPAPAPVAAAFRVQTPAATPAPDAAAGPTRTPTQTATPNPAPPTPPARVAAAPPPPAAEPARVDDTRKGPQIRLDGERTEIKYDGDQGSVFINKDRASMKTPFGKFELKW